MDMSQPDRTQTVLGPTQITAESERRRVPRDPEQEKQALQLAIEAAHLCADRHCENVLIFDLRGLSDVTDFILIASGTSDRQIKAVADEISDLAKQQYNVDRFGTEVDGSTNWLVLDFVDVVIHLFDPATRAHYDLEMMWDDAPRVDWQTTV